jgi:hypothetical protein
MQFPEREIPMPRLSLLGRHQAEPKTLEVSRLLALPEKSLATL